MQILDTDKSITQGNSYVERLYKLLPLEATGLYIFLSKTALNTDQEGLVGILLIATIAILPFYLRRFQNVTSLVQVTVIIISYLIWCANSDPELFARLLERVAAPYWLLGLIEPRSLGMILAFWTFVIPVVHPAFAPAPDDGQNGGNND